MSPVASCLSNKRIEREDLDKLYCKQKGKEEDDFIRPGDEIEVMLNELTEEQEKWIVNCCNKLDI